MLISLTLAPPAKTQLKSEFLPILLKVNAYQCCIPFCFSTEQNWTNRVDWVRLGSVIELNRTLKKVPVRLCSIAELVFGSVSFDYLRRDNYMLSTVMMKKTFLNEAQYCWFLCDVKAAMSLVKNKNISLLGKYTLFFM